MLTVEKPITSKVDDSLERAGFAKNLAEILQNRKNNDGMILGLQGKWGSGKSSIINMVKECLQSSNNRNSPAIVEFNPWTYSSAKSIESALFDEIHDTLAQEFNKTTSGTESNETKVLIKRWELYSARLQVMTALIKIPGIGIIRFICGSLLTPIIINQSSPWYMYFLFVVTLLLSILPQISELTNSLKNLYQIKYRIHKKSIKELRQELHEELRKIERDIIVIIDDIDRLTSDEIRSLVLTIKTNIDFPKIVFLIAYQKDIIESALNEFISTDDTLRGRKYLEKIFTLSFNIPEISDRVIFHMLSAEIKQILDEYPGTTFSLNRWTHTRRACLWGLITSIRDLHRYVNAFRVNTLLLRSADKKNISIDPVDILLLTALDTFIPDVYHRLYAQSYLFTDTHSPSTSREIGSRIHDNIGTAGNAYPQQTTNILKSLFPNAPITGDTLYVESLPVLTNEQLFTDGRVAHLEHFDLFFSVNMDSTMRIDAPAEEILQLSAISALAFQKALEHETQRGYIREKLHHILNIGENEFRLYPENIIKGLSFFINDLKESSIELQYAIAQISKDIVLSSLYFYSINNTIESQFSSLISSNSVELFSYIIPDINNHIYATNSRTKSHSESEYINKLTIYLKSNLLKSIKSISTNVAFVNRSLLPSILRFWEIQDVESFKIWCSNAAITEHSTRTLVNRFINYDPRPLPPLDQELSFNQASPEETADIFDFGTFEQYVDLDKVKNYIKTHKDSIDNEQRTHMKTLLPSLS